MLGSSSGVHLLLSADQNRKSSDGNSNRAGGSRTHTVSLPKDFKSSASAIPPPPLGLNSIKIIDQVKRTGLSSWIVSNQTKIN